MTPQMTIQEQLEIYPLLKKFLTTQPKLFYIPRHPAPPWRVYVQTNRGGPWKKKDFPLYTPAFMFFKSGLKKYHDLTITSRRQAFDPPTKIVRVTRNGSPIMVNTPTGPQPLTREVPIHGLADHRWCMYCRRFTVFQYFTKHHAFSGKMAMMFDPTFTRCTICGIREETGARL